MSSYRTLGLSLALLALTLVAYWPVTHAGFVWDDDQHFVQNPAVTAPDGLKPIWTSFVLPVYYPITFTVFWLIYQLAGPNPLPYHLVTVALHAVNAILLFLILRRLKVRGAWVVAALWAVHPVNVESVAWATELKNTLSGAWFFASLLCFLRYELQLKRQWFVGALFCFAAALLSKSSTVMLPAVLLLLAWWRRGRVVRTDVVRSLPFFALSLLAAFVAIWAQVREKVTAGVGRDWSLQLPERLIVAGKDLWFYVSKTVCPVNLMFIYPRWSHDARLLTEWLPLAGAVLVGIILCQFRRTGAGRAAIFALGYFVIALSPVLGFFDQYFYRYSFVADHFQYLAGIGIIALVIAAGTLILQQAGQKGGRFQMPAAAMLLFVLGVSTWRQIHVYQDLETLWRDTLAKNPGCWMAHNNFGMLLASQDKVPDAVAEYTTALKIKPDFAEAHNNLGSIFAAQGETAKAAIEFTEAVRLNPNLADAHENLGKLLAAQDRTKEAVVEYETALRINPGAAEVHNDLGVTLAGLGRFDEAIGQYQIALRIKPGLASVYFNLAAALIAQNKIEEAVSAYRMELRIGPDDAEVRNSLAIALMRQGNAKEAIAEYQQAVRIKPGFAGAHYNLGGALASQRNFAEALAEYQEAVRLDPDWAPAVGSLAWLLATAEDANLRNGKEAIQWGERFCQITRYQRADALIVLAAAYAEAGRFPEAIQSAQKAIELAKANGQQELVAQAQKHLELYQQGRRLREKSALPSPPSLTGS